MPRFIEVTLYSGKLQVLGLSRITEIGPNTEGGTYFAYNRDEVIHTKESYDEVKRRLGGAIIPLNDTKTP